MRLLKGLLGVVLTVVGAWWTLIVGAMALVESHPHSGASYVGVALFILLGVAVAYLGARLALNSLSPRLRAGTIRLLRALSALALVAAGAYVVLMTIAVAITDWRVLGVVGRVLIPAGVVCGLAMTVAGLRLLRS
jgi:hypothetical protein